MSRVLPIERLPASALDAAAAFHGQWVARARAALAAQAAEGDLVIVMPAATHEHIGWRRAAVQELAREAAPRRVNLIAGGAPDARDAAIAYLAQAPGVTGQYLTLSPSEASE